MTGDHLLALPWPALRDPFALVFFFFFVFFAFFAFGQFATAIFVLCLIVAPFCATNSVGIVSLLVHRSPFAASAEYFPSGKYSSNELTGTSGTVLNMLEVIPALLMNVVPVRSTLTPSPCNTTISDGNASPPWETKYTGPSNPTGSSGVLAFAIPTIDAAGHPAAFASNCAAVQAFCSVVNRDGSCLGRSTLTKAMFASCPCAPLGSETFASRLPS